MALAVRLRLINRAELNEHPTKHCFLKSSSPRLRAYVSEQGEGDSMATGSAIRQTGSPSTWYQASRPDRSVTYIEHC